jgi:putative transposase
MWQHRVTRITRKHKIAAIRGYRKPKYNYSKPSVASPNLVKQQFNVTQANKIWVSDITFIRTYEGWLY